MVIVRIWGGLGNQMFQYAYARALKEKNIDVKLDLNKTYNEVFKQYTKDAPRINCIQNFKISLSSIDVYNYGKYVYLYQDTIIRKVIFWLGNHGLWKYNFYEEKEENYSERIIRIKGNYYIKGWFQNEKYFKKIRNILLNEFIPQNKIKISKKLKQAIKDPQSVSIHIRRGDYIKINHSLNPTYYKKAINYIKQIYNNPIFVVFSDDLEWVKKNVKIDGRYIFVNENKQLQDYEELFIMSRCKSNIISNSTFSWWGAWLNQNKEKIVIAPKKWLRPQQNIIPLKWTIL